MINVFLRIPNSEQYDPEKLIPENCSFIVSKNKLRHSRPGRKDGEFIKLNKKPAKPGKNGANMWVSEFYD